MLASRRKGKGGHPPAGIRPGEKLTDYKRMTIRLPDDVRAKLDATGFVLGRPQWRVLIDAINAYLGESAVLTEAERRAVKRAIQSRVT